ncbi:MAG: hypothetical protein R2710_07220 [Acidimicrobiales bacterium]
MASEVLVDRSDHVRWRDRVEFAEVQAQWGVESIEPIEDSFHPAAVPRRSSGEQAVRRSGQHPRSTETDTETDHLDRSNAAAHCATAATSLRQRERSKSARRPIAASCSP